MRLSEEVLKAIKTLAKKYFGENCEVRMFGSRVDDTQKGGDIDIYISTEMKDGIIEAKASFLAELKRKIGEQKIDILVENMHKPEENSIYEIARTCGIKI
ncbi:nucleotidyltransferase domain-containing protein [Thermodesulfovibrio sp. 3907-1M]|uniref:Nucleotidyltransferase domain-containing protein n=1 Tax=Thermodesulfovibrio autotrophicus TaxID=3118333 RepID=A0AAU8GTT7_9BACT